jgi:hypothetical protein
MPLLIPPVMLCAMLVVVLLITACDDPDPETSPPGPPPGAEVGDVPTELATGNELTPVLTPCGEGVPPAAVEVGAQQTVMGDVVNTRVVEDELGSVTLLEMGEEGGSVPFAIAMTEQAAGDLSASPEELYAGQEVCVNGVVQDLQGTPVIFVASGEEIITTSE